MSCCAIFFYKVRKVYHFLAQFIFTNPIFKGFYFLDFYYTSQGIN